MPSRQERRKAERDAEKRPIVQSAVAVTTAVTEAVIVPLGDWSTQTKDGTVLFLKLGMHALARRVSNVGDRDAQYSLGCFLIHCPQGPQGADTEDAAKQQKETVGMPFILRVSENMRTIRFVVDVVPR